MNNDSINLKTIVAVDRQVENLFNDVVEEVKQLLPKEDNLNNINPELLISQINKVIDQGFDYFEKIIQDGARENITATKIYLLNDLSNKLNKYTIRSVFLDLLDARFDFFTDDAVEKILLRKSYIDGMTIADRITRMRKTTRTIIRGLVYQSIKKGEGPFELASKIGKYVKNEKNLYVTPLSIMRRELKLPISFRLGPNDVMPPGSVKYNALRIARTELAEINRWTIYNTAKDLNFVKGLKWNLSKAHPKKDICDDYANKKTKLGKGVYTPKEHAKIKTHPQCLCYTTIEIKSDDDIIKILQKEYNVTDLQFLGTQIPNSFKFDIEI
jgi:hypothetical protein